jgi:hypothetical protein
MPTSNRIVGITLVVIGLLILLGQMGVDFFGWVWPVLLCAIGGVLLWSWYTRGDDSGKVFSGVLLVLLALFFLFMRRGDADMVRHWPFFVLAPGLSLLVMSRIDRSRRDASVPGWIAIGAALVLYFFTSGLFMGLMGFLFGLIGMVLRLLVPLALIGLGGWMIMNYRQRAREAAEGPSATAPMPEKYEPAPAQPVEVEDVAADEDDEDPTELDTSVGPIPAVRVEEEAEFEDIEDSEDGEPVGPEPSVEDEPEADAPAEDEDERR